MNDKKTFEFVVYGLVQGVGFRPFAVDCAKNCGLTGRVKNSGGVVYAEATGTQADLERFAALLRDGPPGADVAGISAGEAPLRQYDGFRIVQSEEDGSATPLVSPDLPLCGACRQELYEPKNRRFQNPFISCVSCGPRYSVITGLPYDRCRTTMADFPLCAACAGEYSAPGRRDFAQTISCSDCGPFLIFRERAQECTGADALKRAAQILNENGVLAVKGIGGYHFACSPFSAAAVRRLRLLKQRDAKPFAVLFQSVGDVRRFAQVTHPEEELLLSSPRPIVLLARTGRALYPGVCGDSRYLGAFLPYTPLQELLLDACGPLVMTSANVTEQPIVSDDEDILAIRSAYLDGVLYNTRRIEVPQDDSMMRIVAGRRQVLRRSRGIAPLPVLLRVKADRPVFAAGGDMKAAFCLFSGDRAYISQFLGGLENAEAQAAYKKAYRHMRRLFSVQPAVAAHDLHPDYWSTRFARKIGLPAIGVQHHHAHIASVMAEHGITGSIIGVAFDGTGYGPDGAVWGGEFLLCEGAKYTRVGRLSYVPVCGGDNAARDAALCACSYLAAAGAGNVLMDARFAVAEAAAHNGLVPGYSSMGRLFDSVSAILRVKQYNSFEGECACALESLAAAAQACGQKAYPLAFALQTSGGMLIADQAKLTADLVAAMRNGADRGALALGFHRAVARMVLEMCVRIRDAHGQERVALSGGVFANRLLLEDCVGLLCGQGFAVFLNREVPTGDGGVSLGQAFVAALTGQERV